MATVDNIDWPSQPGLSVARQQAELDRILDRAAELNLNALIFQVRPACDALYRSELEPWSEWLTGKQGRAPEPLWDPLQSAIDGARKRGLELHAWFNPFRARHQAAESPLAEGSFAARPGMAVKYGKQLWLDPGVPAVRKYSLAVILDVVKRYDVDGVHIDDYFYPYREGGRDFPDEESFARYVRAGGKLDRSDWRRDCVNRFVRDLHRGIRGIKPWVKLGISPFGIVRPGVPEGIVAGVDQYEHLAADVRLWLHEGWCDYLSPQLYWPIAQQEQSYATLLDWWGGEVPERCHLWIGNFTTKAAGTAKGWSVAELLNQIGRTREDRRATGNVHFSMKVLRDDTSGVAAALRRGPYRRPALIPASPWLDGDPPHAPQIRAERKPTRLEVRWEPDPDVRWRALHLLCAGQWYLVQVVAGSKPGLVVGQAQIDQMQVQAFAVSAVDRCGNESGRVAMRLNDDV